LTTKVNQTSRHETPPGDNTNKGPLALGAHRAFVYDLWTRTTNFRKPEELSPTLHESVAPRNHDGSHDSGSVAYRNKFAGAPQG